jgi:electron transfer flavoprotein beta subunit
MEILVAVKPVPEAETRLRVNPAQTDLDPEGIKWVLAGYDESAVEQALLLREANPGSQVRAISFGPPPRTEEVLRAALAMGCDSATWVERPTNEGADPVSSARAVAPVVQRLSPKLVLVGKQAADDEAGLFGAALAELLEWPDAGCVVSLKHDPAGAKFTYERAVEGGMEVGECAGPMVVGLQQAWNDPRTAKLPNILKSRKAPIDKVPWSETSAHLGLHAPPRTRPVGFRLPAPRTGAKMIEYKTPEEAAQKLVGILKEEAKVFP